MASRSFAFSASNANVKPKIGTIRLEFLLFVRANKHRTCQPRIHVIELEGIAACTELEQKIEELESTTSTESNKVPRIIALENTSLTEVGKVHVLEGTETRLGTCSQISSLEGTSLSEVNTCKYKNTHDDVSG